MARFDHTTGKTDFDNNKFWYSFMWLLDASSIKETTTQFSWQVNKIVMDLLEGHYLRRAGEDYAIRILHNFHGVGNREINAFQTAADVLVQKSTREGFGLVVTEALWKGKPVIGGNVGGIPLQVIDGQTGFLVDDVAACADRMLYLLKNPAQAARLGQAAREHVRRHFLSTRHLADYLRLLNELLRAA